MAVARHIHGTAQRAVPAYVVLVGQGPRSSGQVRFPPLQSDAGVGHRRQRRHVPLPTNAEVMVIPAYTTRRHVTINRRAWYHVSHTVDTESRTPVPKVPLRPRHVHIEFHVFDRPFADRRIMHRLLHRGIALGYAPGLPPVQSNQDGEDITWQARGKDATPHRMRACAGDTIVHIVDGMLGRLVGKANDLLLVELIENDDMVSFRANSAWRADSVAQARQMLESRAQGRAPPAPSDAGNTTSVEGSDGGALVMCPRDDGPTAGADGHASASAERSDSTLVVDDATLPHSLVGSPCGGGQSPPLAATPTTAASAASHQAATAQDGSGV